MNSGTVLDILLSLTVFAEIFAVGLFLRTSFNCRSPWWEFLKNIVPISFLVGLVAAIITYGLLSSR